MTDRPCRDFQTGKCTVPAEWVVVADEDYVTFLKLVVIFSFFQNVQVDHPTVIACPLREVFLIHGLDLDIVYCNVFTYKLLSTDPPHQTPTSFDHYRNHCS